MWLVIVSINKLYIALIENVSLYAQYFTNSEMKVDVQVCSLEIKETYVYEFH